MSKYIWCDLETTGTDERTCQIIEIAVIVTDLKFNVIEQYQTVINPGVLSYEPGALKIHKKSGLVDKIKQGISLAEAERDVYSLIAKHEPYKRRAKLAGNNVHFDRRFMKKYMPSIPAHLSSRHLDVSSIGVLMDGQYGIEKAAYKAPRPHRALEDLQRSIAQLNFYITNFLKD